MQIPLLQTLVHRNVYRFCNFFEFCFHFIINKFRSICKSTKRRRNAMSHYFTRPRNARHGWPCRGFSHPRSYRGLSLFPTLADTTHKNFRRKLIRSGYPTKVPLGTTPAGCVNGETLRSSRVSHCRVRDSYTRGSRFLPLCNRDQPRGVIVT